MISFLERKMKFPYANLTKKVLTELILGHFKSKRSEYGKLKVNCRHRDHPPASKYLTAAAYVLNFLPEYTL